MPNMGQIASTKQLFRWSAADYHALKALSAGGAWTLVEECPLRFWLDSPWNPGQVPDNKPIFDIGTALHLAVLEPAELAERITVIPFADYRTKEARDLRDQAWIDAKTPLKTSELDAVNGMARAIHRHPSASLILACGHPEVSLTWEWDGVPCKARPDYLAEGCVDLKTTTTCNPAAVARIAFAHGWHLRAAWYLAGIAEATGKRPKHYWFVVVERSPPHMIEVYELDPRALAWGEMLIKRALRLFRECMARDEWPTYRAGKPSVLELPSWAEYRLADREAAGEFSQISAADARRSTEWMEP